MQFLRISAAVFASASASAEFASPVFLHTLNSPPDQTRVLQEQIVALKSSQESLEEDKHELSNSMHKLERTRSSYEMRCMRERVVLKQKMKQTLERAENTKVIAEQLQAQNMELRKEAFDATGDEADAKKLLNSLEHDHAVDLFDQQHLKASVKEVLRKDWSASADLTNRSIPEMVALAVSTCQGQNTMLHGVVSNLKANLSATQHHLNARIAESASMAPVIATGGVAQQLEVEGLKHQVVGLEKDKDHLATQLRLATSEADTLRQQLAQMTAEGVAQQLRLARVEAQARDATPSVVPTEDPALGFVTPPISQHQEVKALPQETSPLVETEDPILELVTPPAAQHHEYEETTALVPAMKKAIANSKAAEPAAAASAITNDPLGSPLSSFEVALAA